MYYFISINEFSIFRLLWWLIRNRPIHVLGVEPLFPPLGGLLGRITQALMDRNMTHHILDLCPTLKRVKEYEVRKFQYDVFGETEAWQNEWFGFDTRKGRRGIYDLAYKHSVGNYTQALHIPLLAFRVLFDGDAPPAVRFSGLSNDLVSASKAYLKFVPPTLQAMPTPRVVINLVLTVLLSVYASLWTVVRIRPLMKEPKRFFLGADFIDDARDLRTYQELDEGGPVLLVIRMAQSGIKSNPKLSNYTFCTLSSGRFGLRDGITALIATVGANITLWRLEAERNPNLFYKIITLPFRRLQYRALLRRFLPQYFWGRDPYNADHIIRTQELNAIGSKSFGASVGFMMTYTTMWPQFRYQLFDRYYVFGAEPYRRYYGDSYPDSMTLVSAGTPQVDRQMYRQRFNERPKDILVCAAVFTGEKAFVDLIRALAMAFPDKKVLLQVKPHFLARPVGKKFVENCTAGLANVVPTEDSVYDLILRAQYVISDPSSVVTEAIQFGANGFCFDMPERQKENILREYRGLTIGHGEEAIDRIKGIENGSWAYPLVEYAELIDLSGRTFYDSVRCDMGLAAKEEAIPLLATQTDTTISNAPK
jgi:hypothetical protein